MGVRLHFIVEGQTEETFVNEILEPYLAERNIWTAARCVMTGRKRGITYRGGIVKYAKVKSDIKAWVKQDQNPDARFTTMFDLYGLPKDFPGYEDAERIRDPYDRIRALEDALGEDIADLRFIPYIQLHEFEALLFSELRKLDLQFPDSDAEIGRLEETASKFNSPEHIDDGQETAPSKRIIYEIPEYEGRKASAGPVVAGKIGLPVLRSSCRHFGEWIKRLESLSE